MPINPGKRQVELSIKRGISLMMYLEGKNWLAKCSYVALLLYPHAVYRDAIYQSGLRTCFVHQQAPLLINADSAEAEVT